MNKSEQINELAAALVKFHAEVKPVGFDCSNPFFKSRYASLSALVKAATPVLVKNGLAVSQVMENETAVTTILMHISGQYIESTLKLKPAKDDPQGVGSAITYARRYSYASVLGLVSDEDDDGNAASVPNGNVKHTNPAPAPTPTHTPAPADQNPFNFISEPQRKRLFAIAMQAGMTKEVFKDWLAENWGFGTSQEIPRTKYEEICEAAGGWAQ